MSKESFVTAALIALSAVSILIGVVRGVDRVVQAIHKSNVGYYCVAVASTKETGFSGKPNLVFYQSGSKHSLEAAREDSALIVRDTFGFSYFYTPVSQIQVTIKTDAQPVEDCGCDKE